MPTLAEIHDEIKVNRTGGVFDVVRRKYLTKLHQLTGRPVIVYASAFTVKDVQSNVASQLSINHSDVQSFMSALCELKGNELDLVLHSPGGSAEAAEQLVSYLRSKFRHLRVIIPQNAMSAATMLACAADEIVMGKHSALGPIDPQLNMNGFSVPAQSILDEIATAMEHVNKGGNPVLWAERLRPLPPGFPVQCQKVIQLSKQLVKEWLSRYMLHDDPEVDQKASSISEWLGSNTHFLTHGRAISIDQARTKGLVVKALEDDQDLQDAVLAVFHSTVATFQGTPCVKLVESHLGKGSFIIVQGQP